MLLHVPHGGDRLLAVDGQKVRSVRDIQQTAIRKHALGEEVRVLVQLGSQPAGEIGVRPSATIPRRSGCVSTVARGRGSWDTRDWIRHITNSPASLAACSRPIPDVYCGNSCTSGGLT